LNQLSEVSKVQAVKSKNCTDLKVKSIFFGFQTEKLDGVDVRL
jgi:hypothetical protein